MAHSERLVFLDTETTGLDPKLGHKIIEVGAVEAVDRRLTGLTFHRYLNPDRDIDAGALAVHGITNEFLHDKPRFFEIAAELAQFLEGATIVIHNAAFDLGFLDAEFGALRMRPTFLTARDTVVDSLAIARAKFPGKRNSLDALCERFGVDNSSRNLHGALLDARLLGDMYFALTREQASIEIESEAERVITSSGTNAIAAAASAAEMIAVEIPDALRLAHRKYALGDKIDSPEFAHADWA
ncbi:MAG: DNA polymerase III subunit epsilon [Betaproteobacteria bacterium]|nr:MAG: DNA polymerase III subunit epsilon [Betaproteobacteria bacterium]